MRLISSIQQKLFSYRRMCFVDVRKKNFFFWLSFTEVIRWKNITKLPRPVLNVELKDDQSKRNRN